MNSFARTLAILVLGLAWTTSAQAHFLFVRILPAAEGGRYSEVYFSDHADAGDPRFIAKIASTKLWLQAKAGAFEPLKVQTGDDRLRAFVPAQGTFGVIGECTYGVLGRPKQTAFLLRHYPKAINGRPEESLSLKPKAEIPFEIQIIGVSKELEFVALRHGKPIPGAKFEAVALDLKGQAFTADDQGHARWRPAAPGYYAVYTGQTLKEAGEYQGKKYDEIREFATIAFSWPMHAEGADPEAVGLFQEALAARASWQDFPGFKADVAVRVDGRAWKGTALVSAKGEVELAMEDEGVTPWIQDQLDSLVMHRFARPQSKPPVLRFADHDRDHPLGRLLVFDGGKFASSYRVKDKQLLVVNRQFDKSHMTIAVLDNDRNADGQFLPRSYTVQYWDAADGKLQRTEAIQNRWTRLKSWDLPTLLEVITSSAAGQNVKTIRLSGHQLASPK